MYNDITKSKYWKNKKSKSMIAEFHRRKMELVHHLNIEKSVMNSKIYLEDYDFPTYNKKNNPILCHVIPCTTVDALYLDMFDKCNKKTCVLNFGSFKNPGGKFLEGGSAQEESLCYSSDLFNVLSRFNDSYYKVNRMYTNRALYYNRAIYTPDIIYYNKTNYILADTITCAAPNRNTAVNLYKVSEGENKKILDDRIRFILDIAEDNKVDNLILGAFGCGVFGQSPYEVACIFNKYLKSGIYSFKTVIFAIPPSKGHGEINYKEFIKVIL